MRATVPALIAVLLMLTGCGPSRADLETWVKGELQKHVQTDPILKAHGITVESVQLVESGKNQYEGMGIVKFQGAEKAIPLEVAADGERMMYQTKPTAFDFVAQAELQAAQNAMEAEIAAADAEMRKLEAEMAADQAEMDAANDELEAALKSAEAEMDAANAELGASMQFGE